MKRLKGFTFVEIMIVITILGMMGAFAYPAYVNYKVRVQRQAAQAEMMGIARKLANYNMANGNYSGRTAQNVYGGTVTPLRGTALYDLSLTDISGVALTQAAADTSGWRLTATPKAGTQQAGNGIICLNSLGQKYWAKAATACVLSASSTWEGR